jgi:hypothetical protein
MSQNEEIIINKHNILIGGLQNGCNENLISEALRMNYLEYKTLFNDLAAINIEYDMPSEISKKLINELMIDKNVII